MRTIRTTDRWSVRKQRIGPCRMALFIVLVLSSPSSAQQARASGVTSPAAATVHYIPGSQGRSRASERVAPTSDERLHLPPAPALPSPPSLATEYLGPPLDEGVKKTGLIVAGIAILAVGVYYFLILTDRRS